MLAAAWPQHSRDAQLRTWKRNLVSAKRTPAKKAPVLGRGNNQRTPSGLGAGAAACSWESAALASSAGAPRRTAQACERHRGGEGSPPASPGQRGPRGRPAAPAAAVTRAARMEHSWRSRRCPACPRGPRPVGLKWRLAILGRQQTAVTAMGDAPLCRCSATGCPLSLHQGMAGPVGSCGIEGGRHFQPAGGRA